MHHTNGQTDKKSDKWFMTRQGLSRQLRLTNRAKSATWERYGFLTTYKEIMKHKVSAKGITMAYMVLLLWPIVYFFIVNCFAVIMACTEIIKIKEMNPFFAWTFGPWVVLLLTFPLPLLLSLVVSICVLMPLMAMMSKFVPSRSFLIGAILIAAILVSPLFFLEKLH